MISLHKNVSNLAGREFTRLTVIKPVGKTSNRKIVWLCRCLCGKTLEVVGASLVSKNTESCGCLHIDKVTTHRSCRSSEYKSWSGMLSRCRSETNPDWDNYGGRGITVCDRWLEFENFLEDMRPKPSPKHSIDRINNNGNYEPINCRWATRVEQDNNKRTNRMLTYNGETMCLTAWARRIGMNPVSLHSRIAKGMSVEEAVTTPVRRHHRR